MNDTRNSCRTLRKITGKSLKKPFRKPWKPLRLGSMKYVYLYNHNCPMTLGHLPRYVYLVQGEKVFFFLEESTIWAVVCHVWTYNSKWWRTKKSQTMIFSEVVWEIYSISGLIIIWLIDNWFVCFSQWRRMLYEQRFTCIWPSMDICYYSWEIDKWNEM